jgi:hypothetical protein
MTGFLTVTVPDENRFYSLYSDGNHAWKHYDAAGKATRLIYPKDAVVILYYTYPTHREACVIRNDSGSRSFPGLSKKVSLLFSVQASKVDKLKRAAGFLKKRSSGAFSSGDGFYIRLFFIIARRGKLNYPALSNLSRREASS